MLATDRLSVRLETLADEWKEFLGREGKSPKTVDTYRGAVTDMLRFLYNHGATTSRDLRWPAGRDLLEGWQDSLFRKGLALKSRALYVGSAKSFTRWLLAEDHLDDRRLYPVLRRPSTPPTPPRPVPAEDLERLQAVLLSRHPRMSPLNLRDRALWWWLLASGCGASEALSVKREEVSSALVWFRIPAAIASMVRAYLATRNDVSPWLWVTYDRNRPTRQLDYPGLREAMRRIARQCSVRVFSLHQLRHSSETLLDESGLRHVMSYARRSGSRRSRARYGIEDFTVGPPPVPAPKSVRARLPVGVDPDCSHARVVPPERAAGAPILAAPAEPAADWTAMAARL